MSEWVCVYARYVVSGSGAVSSRGAVVLVAAMGDASSPCTALHLTLDDALEDIEQLARQDDASAVVEKATALLKECLDATEGVTDSERDESDQQSDSSRMLGSLSTEEFGQLVRRGDPRQLGKAAAKEIASGAHGSGGYERALGRGQSVLLTCENLLEASAELGALDEELARLAQELESL